MVVLFEFSSFNREVGERSYRAESSTSSTSPWTSVSTRISEQFKSTSVEQGKCESSTMQEAFHARLRLANSTSSGEADQWNEESRRFQASNHQLISSEIEEHSNAGPSLINKDAGNKAGSTGLPSPYEYEEDLQASFPSDYSVSAFYLFHFNLHFGIYIGNLCIFLTMK